MRKIVIVLGGEAPGRSLFEKHLKDADQTIAADSGLACFKAAGHLADVAVGDFDSFDGDPKPYAHTCVYAPEQDATDFQKALREVKSPDGNLHITVLGGTGKRSDHFLTNLLIVSEKWPDVHFEFHDTAQSIHRVTPQCPLNLSEIEPGLTVSLIPLSRATGVHTQGLHWELSDADMEPNGQLGQSNVAEKQPLTVSIKTGSLFVIVNQRAQ